MDDLLTAPDPLALRTGVLAVRGVMPTSAVSPVSTPTPDVRALLDEVHALRAEIERLQLELAATRAVAAVTEAGQLGRTLLAYALDTLFTLLNVQRGQVVIAHIGDPQWRMEAKDAMGSIGPLQLTLERPALDRSIAGQAGRLATRYGASLWLPILHNAAIAVVLCLRRGPNSPFSEREQEMGEVLGPLVLSALQTGHRHIDPGEPSEALANLTAAFNARIRLGGGPVATLARDAERLAQRFQLDGNQHAAIRLAAILHDIGTVDLAEDLLTKQDPLNQQEIAQIREHAAFGAAIAGQIGGMEDVIPLVRHHHERWDGAGYPSGLAGVDIPFGARIIAVVDAFHAMTSDRSYRPARSVEDALAELRRNADTQFDGDVVDEFARLLAEGH